MQLIAVTHWISLQAGLRINGSLKTFAWYKYKWHSVAIAIHCLVSSLSLLITMKFQLCLLLLAVFTTAIHAIVIQPQPTRTADAGALLRRQQGSPTPAPKRFIKRDLEESLSLYENWANDCNYNNNNDNNAKVAVSDLNNLWQTVTSTVYCGNGNVKTVTKTVTATKQTTTTKSSGGSGGSSSGNKKPACDDKCWSTYLWRKSCHVVIYVASF